MAEIEGKLEEGGEKSCWKRRERYYPKYFPISARRNDWRECWWEFVKYFFSFQYRVYREGQRKNLFLEAISLLGITFFLFFFEFKRKEWPHAFTWICVKRSSIFLPKYHFSFYIAYSHFFLFRSLWLSLSTFLFIIRLLLSSYARHILKLSLNLFLFYF